VQNLIIFELMMASSQAYPTRKQSAKLAVLALCIALLSVGTGTRVKAQWLEPTRLYMGMSGGFGGLHAWGKPSLDLIYGRWTARFAPGLRYLSGGVTYHLAHFSPKTRHDRIVILSLYYHNDWLLANKKSFEFRRDQNIWMLMPGIHVNLDHRGTIFMEVSGGLMYQHERIFNSDKTIRSAGDHFAPMGELRIGGIFLSRVEHVQQFPHYFKEKPAKKIQRKRLHFD
jgi:hypothetical protein